ncbi:hypothetical protein T10_11144 [Trichinella papuae]|uniref:Uncharacterized protein n=1 Tax=Trichinella papuae TaxID=268474 RepID=A0A0V1N9C7_9BILA|nr:hypothetical protein T10_11144 [Trichinella papuae]
MLEIFRRRGVSCFSEPEDWNTVSYGVHGNSWKIPCALNQVRLYWCNVEKGDAWAMVVDPFRCGFS